MISDPFLLVSLLLVGAAMILMILLVPQWQLRRVRDQLKISDRIDLEIKSRALLAQVLGGFFLLIGLYSTWKTLDLTRQAELSDRFMKSVELLSNSSLPVRVGAIASLEQVTQESESYRWSVMELLAAYIRDEAPWPADPDHHSGNQRVQQASLDIQAALDVLKKQDWTKSPRQLNLTNTDLRGADLEQANLDRAFLSNANLSGANLADATLTHCDLANSILHGANLAGANLDGAILIGVDLRSARLDKANITVEQVNSAQWTGQVLLEKLVSFDGPLRVARRGDALTFFISQPAEIKPLIGTAIQLRAISFDGELDEESQKPFAFDLGMIISQRPHNQLWVTNGDIRQLLKLQKDMVSSESLHVVVQSNPRAFLRGIPLSWTATSDGVTGQALRNKKFFLNTSRIEVGSRSFFVQLYGWTYWGGDNFVRFRRIRLQLRYVEL